MVRNNNHSVFPPQAEFERVVQRISKSDKRTNFGLLPNASDEQKAKYKFCKTIALYTLKNGISEQELAKRLRVSHSKVEEVIFCHINELDLKELVDYVAKLSLPWEIKVNIDYAREKTTAKTY
jgi:predicted XRE-type DNA-binding protein